MFLRYRRCFTCMIRIIRISRSSRPTWPVGSADLNYLFKINNSNHLLSSIETISLSAADHLF